MALSLTMRYLDRCLKVHSVALSLAMRYLDRCTKVHSEALSLTYLACGTLFSNVGHFH